VIGATDPLTLGAFRFGIGGLLLLPMALAQNGRWPRPSDWPGVLGLGCLFFGLFPVLFNAALAWTTAARGALALSTLPLLTMLTAALLGVEALGGRKTIGVLIAMVGVAIALLAGLRDAPAGAWRGDLLMVGAAMCMALYNVWSKPFIRRSGALPFTTLGMTVGAVCLAIAAAAQNELADVAQLEAGQWIAVLYLGIFGGAVTFWLWSYALLHTTPTRVAVAVTVNPVAAAAVGAGILNEPLHWNLAVGLAAVLAGIWLAVTGSSPALQARRSGQPAARPLRRTT
jgi:drug/metabolite transporter (DMT)-like permease